MDGHSIYVNESFRAIFGAVPPAEYNVSNDEIAEASGSLHLIRQAFQGKPVDLPVHWYEPRLLKQVHLTEGRRAAIKSNFKILPPKKHKSP